MNNELTDEAIEEARLALYQLEKELKDRANDAVSLGSHKQHSSTNDERRILDQMPRVARLNNRLESLGLTVEELDDRGLLDGGGSVPSYYTSMKNKSRRTLELQSRSYRLQGRDKETFTKLLNSFLHMIRTLVRKGLNFDVYCRRHDPNRRGLMKKKAFLTMLKTIGLPFSARELQDITLHYMVPASDQADYVSLLKDARIVNLGAISNTVYDQEQEQQQSQLDLPETILVQGNDDLRAETENDPDNANVKSNKSATGDAANSNDGHGNSPVNEPVRGDLDLSIHTLVLADVRRMLLESIRSLNKGQDDVYRMFARWDTNGTGTVTATQFLRVLARLHVNLSDQDQDFLVELLDTNAMGRIDFEGLIGFCFASQGEAELLSPVGAVSGGGSLSMGEDNLGNETMSAVSTEGNNSVDLKSFSSNHKNNGRPRTATLSRPYNEHMSNAHSNGQLYAPTQQYYHHHEHGGQHEEHLKTVSGSRQGTNPRGIQRPLTASARVSTAQNPTSPGANQAGQNNGRFFADDRHSGGLDGGLDGGLGDGGKHIKTRSLVMDYGYSDRAGGMRNGGAPVPVKSNHGPSLPRVGGQAPNQKQLSFHRGTEAEDSQYVVELPDDVMHGEEKYLGSDSARAKAIAANAPHHSGGIANKTAPPKNEPLPHAVNNYVQAPKDNGPRFAHGRNDHNNNNTNNYYDTRQYAPDMQDMGSFNDNTLVTDQDEYFFGSPKEIPQVNNNRNNVMNNMNGMNNNAGGNLNVNNSMSWALGQGQGGGGGGNNGQEGDMKENRTRARLGSGEDNRGGGYDPRDPRDQANNNLGGNNNTGNMGHMGNRQPTWREAVRDSNNGAVNQQSGGGNNNMNMNASGQADHNAAHESSAPAKEPIDHLVLLANQILTTLREIIMGRYRRGKSLQEIYQHFDRDDKYYFDSRDFVVATADLRIETSPRVASIAINMIALDGYDKVSFGEFKVFVLDSDHKLLELNVQEQLAQMLEQKGREYQSFMAEMFWSEEESLNGSRLSPTGRAYRQNEFVSKSAFISSLQRIGLVLTSSELTRLVDRFDVYGNEMCSVLRFVRMVQTSRAWRHGEKVLAYQDEAIEEAEFLRQQLNTPISERNPALPDLPEELISMCEYLGIRVLSEPNMVWIAADALKAPLPISWTAQRDASGRTYFYNHLSNQSKLEHPLDPHFRKLRDRYRQGGAMEPELDGSVGLNGPVGGAMTNNALPAKNSNAHISFGGFGAALNPPALNHNLTSGPRPQPPADAYMQQYLMASNHSAYPAVVVNQQHIYQSSSLQPAVSEDERAYAKYGTSNMNPQGNMNGNNGNGNGNGNGHLLRTQSSGTTRPGVAPGGNPAPANRRPQSALDRTPHSAANNSNNNGYFPQQPGQGGDGGNGPSGGPAGISPGMYTAELRALMGSAAYNRPVSAPQNHHINVENLTSYQEATQRMKEKEERQKSTREHLEAVYKAAPYNPSGLPRTGSSAALPTPTQPAEMKFLNPSSSGNVGGNGGRPGSAKWGNATSPALSAVDRALSIGKGTAAYLQTNPTNRGGTGNGGNAGVSDHHAPTSGVPRERARSAARGSRQDRGAQQDVGRTLPIDNYTKQARLSEMFDEGILDKLDSAIGLPKR